VTTPLEDIIKLVSSEEQHSAAINECFIYFAALAETRYRRAVSDLFEVLPPGLPTDCNNEIALRLHQVITDFVEKCPSHPNVASSFRILFHLKAEDDLKDYLLSKLKFYYAQGDAQNVYQICIVLEDLGLEIFRDEKGAFMQSRSFCDAETNLGVARRFLERLK
jgi:hypothetical protein